MTTGMANPEAMRLKNRIAAVPPDDLATTIVTPQQRFVRRRAFRLHAASRYCLNLEASFARWGASISAVKRAKCVGGFLPGL